MLGTLPKFNAFYFIKNLVTEILYKAGSAKWDLNTRLKQIKTPDLGSEKTRVLSF